MRAVFILLIGAGLIWLVLQSFHRGRTAAAAPQEPAGYLLPAAPPAPSPRSDSKTAPEPEKPAENPAPTRSSAPPPVPVPAPRPENRVVSESPAALPERSGAPAPDEITLASLLLHHTQEVPTYLDGPGKSLPAGRRELALALHRLLVGPVDEARRMAENLDSREGVLASERAFLKQALSSANAVPVPAAAAQESPLVAATSLARLAREGEVALGAGKSREAAQRLGELLLAEVGAPWKADKEALRTWSDALARAQAGYRWNHDGGWPSIDATVAQGDSLISVRKRVIQEHPGSILCTGQIERVNGVRGGVIQPGQVLKIPTERANMLVDLDAHWALYRMEDEVVAAWEIGVGKPGSETPPGDYIVGEKTSQPMWFRPGHDPVPYGDPENPLGSRWIAWQRSDGSNTGLGFHGTKDPASIGEDLSQGCVRMRQAAIEELFEILPRGAAIHVQP